MALSEKARTTIYQGLELILGEEAVGEMLSYFPARDVEEPATKEFIRAEMAGVRAEIAGLRAELVGDITRVDGRVSSVEERLGRLIESTVRAADAVDRRLGAGRSRHHVAGRHLRLRPFCDTTAGRAASTGSHAGRAVSLRRRGRRGRGSCRAPRGPSGW